MTPETLAEALAGDEDIVIGTDLYNQPDDGLELGASDPVSDAVGTAQFMADHVLDECFLMFEDGGRVVDPERFDRFYWRPDRDDYQGPAPVLIDIIRAGTDEERQAEELRKHVEFKRAWCAEHDRRYVVLVEDDCQTIEQVRAALAGHAGSRENPIAVTVEKPKRPARRGRVQRPRADQ